MTSTDSETNTDDDVGGRVLAHRTSTGRPTSERRTRRRRRFAIVAIAAAAATAVTVGLATTGNDPARPGAHSVYADELVAFAEAAPRLLITADGWSITRADESGPESGEVEFTNGDRIIGVFWRPLAEHQSYLDDRLNGQESLGAITVDGHDGTLVHYPAPDGDRYAALWTDSEHSLELDGYQASEADFRALAATIVAVDVDTWLGAMPESVISPTSRTSVITDMLAGIPVPPGFDQSALGSSGISDRYQLGAQVAGAVTCGWLDIWVAAEAGGDQAGMAQAAQALATSRDWAILLEMDADGDYPEVVWEFADALAADGITVYGSDVRDREYVEGLGCSA